MAYSNWKKERIVEIQQYLGDECNCKYVSFNLYNHNTTPILKEIIMSFDLILGYDNSNDFYIAWNPKLHSNIKNNTHTFGIGRRIKFAELEKFNAILSIYKTLKNGNGDYEKIVLIKPDYIKEFCENYSLYLYPDKDDDGFDKKVICEYNGEIVRYSNIVDMPFIETRKRYTCSHLERSATFRKNILDKYNHTCIVCGAEEDKMLQAAHIISVEKKGSDDINNGYCLCANHHLLFDAGKLYIDIENGIFNYTENISDPWKNGAEDRGFKLFLPNDKEEK